MEGAQSPLPTGQQSQQLLCVDMGDAEQKRATASSSSASGGQAGPRAEPRRGSKEPPRKRRRVPDTIRKDSADEWMHILGGGCRVCRVWPCYLATLLRLLYCFYVPFD